jgi:hypothetical protein
LQGHGSTPLTGEALAASPVRDHARRDARSPRPLADDPWPRFAVATTARPERSGLIPREANA